MKFGNVKIFIASKLNSFGVQFYFTFERNTNCITKPMLCLASVGGVICVPLKGSAQNCVFSFYLSVIQLASVCLLQIQYTKDLCHKDMVPYNVL